MENAIHAATTICNPDMFDLLLRRGANVFSRDSDDRDILIKICSAYLNHIVKNGFNSEDEYKYSHYTLCMIFSFQKIEECNMKINDYIEYDSTLFQMIHNIKDEKGLFLKHSLDKWIVLSRINSDVADTSNQKSVDACLETDVFAR